MLDQHGTPMVVSTKLRKHLRDEAEAFVRQASSDTAAMQQHPCELSAWTWGIAAGSRGVLHSSVDVKLPLNLCEERADFTLRVEVPCSLDPMHIPPQVEVLEICMPISVRSFRERVAAGAAGVKYQAAWETRNGTVAGVKSMRRNKAAEHVVKAGVNGYLDISLFCVEDSVVEVAVNLADAQGCGAQDTEFLVITNTLPPFAGERLTVGSKIKSVDSKLVLQLQVRWWQ